MYSSKERVHVLLDYLCIRIAIIGVCFPAQGSPFGSLWYSIVSIIVYTVGGPDNLVLHLSSAHDNVETDHFIFPVISYFLWIIFIIAMSVLFLNLLVSQCTM